MIETIKIGHMIGPPLRKLSIRKFVQPVLAGGAVGAAGEAAGLSVAEIAGLGIAPGAAGEATAPGAAGEVMPGAAAAGDVIAPGAAGCCCGIVVAGGCPAGWAGVAATGG